MSQNITAQFLKCLRPGESGSLDAKASSPARGAFSLQADGLASEVKNVRRYLSDWRKRGVEQLMINEDAGDLANHIGKALNQCGQLLQGLKKYAQLGDKQDSSLVPKHQFGVCKDLEERLGLLKRDYDKQVSG